MREPAMREFVTGIRFVGRICLAGSGMCGIGMRDIGMRGLGMRDIGMRGIGMRDIGMRGITESLRELRFVASGGHGHGHGSGFPGESGDA